MSKPRDPVIAVLKYFEEAPLPLAQQALSLAGALVKKRAAPSRAQPARPVASKPPLVAAGRAE